MTPEQYEKINGIFHRALALDASEREAFLRRECGSEKDYQTLKDMLGAHLRTGPLDQLPPGGLLSQPRLFAGQSLAGRYRVIRFIARGGMGEVFEAEDLELKERVALKVLLPEIANDAGAIARFMQEIRLSRKIAHPNVCRVFDLARHPADGSSAETVVFLSMELLEGETLARRIRSDGRMAADVALPILEQIAAGVDAAHQCGIIHRDLKPGNVMLTTSRTVVTDFGLARSFRAVGDSTVTMTAKLMGTPPFMAPELSTHHPATVASDVYAIGVMAFEMVTGVLPGFKLPAQSPRSIVPELPPAWDRAIVRALDPDPLKRFMSAKEFVGALGQQGFPWLNAIKRRTVAAAAASLILLVGGGFGWRAWDRQRKLPPPEASAFYRTGIDDIHAGAYFAATKALDQAVRIAPRFGLAHARLAEAWNELELTEKATQEMLIARREDISSLPVPDRLQMEAIDRTITREFDSAIPKYEELWRLTVSKAAIDRDLGNLYDKAGKPAKALETLLRATQEDKRNAAPWVRLGALYSRNSEWSRSEDAFRRADELYQLSSNLEGLTELQLQRGISANLRGSLAEASNYLRHAFETARLAGNIHQQLNAELRLATNAYLSGDSTAAERYSREALETARANQMDALATRGLVNLGNAYLRKRDFTGAETNYQEALALARHSQSRRLTALSQLSLAGLHDQLDRALDAAREAEDALAFYQNNRFARETLQCLTLLGRARSDRGDYEAAREWFQRALTAAEAAGDHLQMALAHESIGTVLYDQQKYIQSLEEFRIELMLSSDPQQAGYAALHSGEALWILGRYTEARMMLDRAGAGAERYPSLLLTIQKARADLALSENQFAEAAVLARMALAAAAGTATIQEAQLRRILGLSEVAAGNRGEGLRECEQSLAIAKKIDALAMIANASLAVGKARIEIGDRAGALKLLREVEPQLARFPEFRWRGYALMAQADLKYAPLARQALAQLAAEWGEAAFRDYQGRPDVQNLARPFLQAVSAKKQ